MRLKEGRFARMQKNTQKVEQRDFSMWTDVGNAQEHTYTIDEFNQYRELDKRTRWVYDLVEQIEWDKFHAQTSPSVVVARHFYSKSGRQKLFMDRMVDQAPSPPPTGFKFSR
jgi:hypothetical protein